MNYQEQLQTNEWKVKRVEILERDNFCCKNCNIKRSPFLRLSNNYGIKNYELLKENHCFSLEINPVERNVTYLDGKSGFINSAIFVTENENEIILENLKFALQKVENNNPNSFQLICFTEDRKSVV